MGRDGTPNNVNGMIASRLLPNLLPIGSDAKVQGTFNRDTLEKLRFHPDPLKVH
jgi:hypothetical protein